MRLTSQRQCGRRPGLRVVQGVEGGAVLQPDHPHWFWGALSPAAEVEGGVDCDLQILGLFSEKGETWTQKGGARRNRLSKRTQKAPLWCVNARFFEVESKQTSVRVSPRLLFVPIQLWRVGFRPWWSCNFYFCYFTYKLLPLSQVGFLYILMFQSVSERKSNKIKYCL